MIYCEWINLKTCDDPFLSNENDFLKNKARGIISGFLPLICDGNQDNGFSKLS